MDLNRDNMKKLMLLIAFAVCLLVGVQRLDVVLGAIAFVWEISFPLVLGSAIAFILNVPMTALEKRLFPGRETSRVQKKLARPASLILAIVLVIAIISVVIFVVVPELSATIALMGKNVEAFLPRAEAWLTELFSNNAQITEFFNNLELNWEKIAETFFSWFESGAGNVLSSTVSMAKGLISAFTTFFIAFVFACYLLIQKEKLGDQMKKLLQALFPEKRVTQILYVTSLSNRTFSSFITGQCLEAVILGLMFFVVMSLFGFPYALMISVLIAFTALIPMVGAFIGCAVGAFLILMVNPMQALAFLIVFLVLQQIEGNFVYPHVVGNSIGLPSIWVLVAVSVGASLMGVMGMLIFIPLVSVLYTLLREWVYKRLKEKKIG